MAFFERLFNKFKRKSGEDQKNEEHSSAESGLDAYKDELEKNKIVVFLIPNIRYQDELLKIAKAASQKFSRIVYVSINRPAEKIAEILKQNNVDAEKFLFIDAGNKGVNEISSYHNFVLINSPNNFEKFAEGMKLALEKEKLECILFDSLSTMLIYEDQSTVIRFIHDIIRNISLSNAEGVFTCLLGDVNSVLIKDIAMFVDKVVEVREMKETKDKEFHKQGAIEKLEVELDSIKRAFASNLISEKSYLNTKQRIEKRLEKLRK